MRRELIGATVSRAARYLVSPTKAELLTGKSILELGSGVGLTGVLLAASGLPRHVVCSDCHPRVLEALRRNVSQQEEWGVVR